MSSLTEIGPAFVEMSHRIVWCTGATVTAAGEPRTRVLHPIWEWDGSSLTGWIATSPESPKASDLASTPSVSLNYWAPSQDTCTADCDTEWELSSEQREAGWARFSDGPEPVGYDPSIIPGWDSPESPTFGILRLTPRWLRLMDGSFMLSGGTDGRLMTWRR